jgi:hypothetical protein
MWPVTFEDGAAQRLSSAGGTWNDRGMTSVGLRLVVLTLL